MVGDTPTSATRASIEYVQCYTPAQESITQAHVALIFDSHHVGQQVVFSYYDVPIAFSSLPAWGPSSGGTLIDLVGRGFTATANIRCRFVAHGEVGRLVLAQRVSGSQHVQCTCPAPAVAGVSLIEYSLNSQQFSRTGQSFRFDEPISLLATSPQSGNPAGGTHVSITGSNFLSQWQGPLQSKLRMLRCRFDNIVVSATLTETIVVGCYAPRHAVVVVQVSVSNNGVDFSNFVAFSYSWPGLVSLTPTFGPVQGGTRIQIHGSSLLLSVGASCVFDSTWQMPATFITSRLVSCVTPGRLFGPADVIITSTANGSEVSTTILRFDFQRHARVISVQPAFGPACGGTLVRVLGSHFVPTRTLLCKFGTTVVQALWRSHEELACVAPAIPLGTNSSSILVTTNGQQFVGTARVTFEQIVWPTVDYIFPRSGPIGGGTRVIVRVRNLYGRVAHCRFGVDLVVATIVTSEVVHCITPPHSMGWVPIDLHMNAVDISSSVVFHFVNPPELHMTPSHGPVLGGTRVTLSHNSREELRCAFIDNSVVFAQIESTGLVSCTSPAFPVSLTTIRLQSVAPSDVATHLFDYEQTNMSISIETSAGPISGGTLIKIITNQRLHASDFAYCKFGTSHVVPARSISTTEISCATPSWSVVISQVQQSREVAFYVSTNGQNYVQLSRQFSYYDNVELYAVEPAVGPIGGGINLTVFGAGFQSRSQQQLCRIGASDSLATYINSTHLMCRLPIGASPGIVAISLSLNNGHEFAGTYLLFEYYIVGLLQHLIPNLGPIAGGTRVVATVASLRKALRVRCAFDDVSVPASLVDLHHVQCYSPPWRNAPLSCG